MAGRRPDIKRKLVVVGDGGTGKAGCTLALADDASDDGSLVWPDLSAHCAYVPTVFENYVTQVTYETKLVELALWDTAGQEEYDRLRPLSYPESDVILIVYAIDFPPSMLNVQDKWYPEVSHFCENTPLLLVGTKTDLRKDDHTCRMLSAQGQTPVTAAQGATLAKEIGAKYVECSSKTGQGVQEVFSLALKESMRGKWGKMVKQKRCIVT